MYALGPGGINIAIAPPMEFSHEFSDSDWIHLSSSIETVNHMPKVNYYAFYNVKCVLE